MGNTQFAVLLATLFIGIIWQRVDTFQLNLRMDRIQAELGARIDALTSRIDRISDDLLRFYQTLGAHGEAIDTLKKR